ncbi:MAG: hypothetical protein QME60_05915 [Verrucomicrobiota bacterium]|nr:hypothetical protein [Verrucomicrobiota bacterium]
MAAERALLALLAIFACLSFRDAWRFKRTRNPDDIILRLPGALRDRIRGIVKRGIGFRSVALGGAAVGAAATALESACTGQVLVPTLALIIRGGRSVRHELSLLMAYNAMFVVPLVIAFVLVHGGLRAEALARWSRNNVALSKTLLGILFLALAAAMLALR